MSIGALFDKAVSDAIKELLSTKHLYQSVTVDGDKLLLMEANEIAKKQASGPRTISRAVSGTGASLGPVYLKRSWQPVFAGDNQPVHNGIVFTLPTINTPCETCDYSPPHNPVEANVDSIEGIYQCFAVNYECQQCHREPVRFLVLRNGLKLTLVGRAPIEVLPPPKALPKDFAKYFSDARIAYHAGQTLAGLFLLRVFIEQFWKSIPAVIGASPVGGRLTGDEMGAAYQATLPPEFNSRFPSLKQCYEKLSQAIHGADADGSLFEEAAKQIERHFEARRIFEL